MTREILRTARLELHPTGPGFLHDLWAASESSRAELARWMPWAVESKLDDVRNYVEGSVESWSAGSAYNFTVLEEGVVCGQCSLNRVDSPAGSCDIGYWLRTDRCGRGLATEAALAVIDFGFGAAGLHRIELHAGVDNAASNRIAQKLGFRREGVMRGRGLGAGGHYDMYLYALLEDDERPNL